MFRTDRFTSLLSAALVGLLGLSAQAQLFWDGSASNNWGTAANWNTQLDGLGADQALTAGADVIFTITGGGANLSTTLGGNRTINSLTVNGSLGVPLTIANNTLTLSASGGTGMDLSAAANTVSFTSLITLGSSQTWLLSPTHDLSLTQNIGGAAHTLTIDGSGGGTINIGDTTNNSYDVDHLVLTNGATLRTTQDNSFSDYNTSLHLDAGTTYDRNGFADAFAGLSGGGMLSNANATLDLRPTGSESFVFSGTFSGTEFTNFQITAGAGQRDLVTGTQMFATALSGAGNLQVLNGTGGFSGADGSMNLAVGTINIGRNDTATTSEGNLATLLLDSSTGNHSTQNRLDDAEQINIRTSGQFQIIGNGAALTTEDVGPLNLAVSNSGTPHGIITLTDGGAGVALTSDELIRATGTSMLVRGDGLGTGAAGAGVTTLSFGTTPTLTTAGSGSGTGLNILPYLVGDISSAGLGANFVTYGVDGLRPLGAGEYAGAITSGANVDLSSSPAALGGNADLLALKLSGSGVTVDLGGNTLDIQNGAIISAGSGAASLSNGTITFGSEVEGFLHMPSDLNLGATIADNGGPTSVVKSGAGTLTITAPQTYTGGTYLNEGTTVILGANRLTTNRSNVNGTLDLSDASTTHTAIGMLSGSARGRIDLGDNSLEINGGGGNTSYFGTLDGGAGAVLTKSGGNTFTWRSNNNLALTPFAGTLNVTGGVFEIQDSQGRFDTASAINISNGGTLLLDNQNGSNNQNQNNRISNTAVITMDRGLFTFTGSNNTRSDETVGEIVFNSGYNIISLDADFGGNTASNTSHGDALLRAASLTRNNRATGLIRGDNLGFGINGTADTTAAAVTTGGQAGDPGGSESNLRLTTAPTLSHNVVSGTGRGVIPWLTGGGTAGNSGNTLVSFGGAEGIRLLDISPTTTDYSFQEAAAPGTLSAAAIANQNTYIDFTANNSDLVLDGDATVRGLVIDNTGGTGSDLNLGGFILTVESGIILSTGNQDNQILVGGSITFGNNDATGYEGRIHGIRTIVIDSPITDNGANPVSLTLDGNVQIRGDNTYTGDTVINTGRVYAYTSNGSTNRIPDTSVLTVNGNGRLAINASDETVGGLEGTGFVENYNNTAANESTFTINNSGDHVFQGVVLNGRAAPLHFVKDGAGSQTLTGPSASTYTGTTGLMEGTLVLGGGLTDRLNPATVVTFGDITDNTSGVLVLGDAQGPLDQTLAGIDVVGTGTANRIAGGNASVSTLTLNQPNTLTFAGSLGGAAGNEAQLGVVKNDVGELTVTGNAVYAGPTTVNGGKLIYQGAGSDLDGAITVNGGELRVTGAGLLGADSGSVITVADGGSLIFADGGTNQTFAGTGSILNLTQSSGVTQLGFGLDAGTNDRITLGAGQSLTLTGLIDTVIVVDGAPTLTSYLLIDSAADGAFGGTGAFQIGAIENAGNFIYNIAREGTGSDPDQLFLTVTANTTPPPDDAWWKGDLGLAAAGSWGAVQLGGDSNWDTSQSGGVDAAVPPGANSHVHFSADGAGNFATQLLQDLTIKALTFHSGSGTNGVSVGGTGILTIGNGTDLPSLTVESGGNDAITISTPVALGASQSWNVEDASSVLTVSGGIGGTGDLTLNDSGTASGSLLLAGTASSFVGNLAVNGGKLIFQDTGSLSSGNDVTLASGTSIELGTGTAEATGAALGGLNSSGGASVIGGSANLSTLILGPLSGASTYTGTIGGAANANNLNLVKDGAGTQILDGAVSLAGTTLVQEGVLQFGSSATFAPGGTLSVIAEDGATAVLDINGASFTTSGTTTLGGLGTGATPQIIDTAGTGLITLGGAIVYDSTNDPLGGLISANIALGGASRTITVNDSVSATTDLAFSGAITETGNFSLNLAGTGTGLISGPVTLATSGGSSDVNVNTTGTWIIENAVSFGDDFNANDGTVIVQGAGQIAATTGDDLLLGNDNDSLPATVELNVANAFVGDDVEVRSGSLLKIGADGALTEGTDAANNPDGMNDLNVGTGGLATPGGSTVDLQGFGISVDNFVLGGRLNSLLPDLIQGNIIDSSVGRTGVITTTANNTLRLGEVSAGLAGTGLLLKEWEGDVTLSGNNTRTGRTEIRGGNLILDFSTATVDTETRLSATDELRMGRNNWDDAPSRLTVNGHATLDITQTVSNTQFTSGAATIDVNSAGGVMNLNMGAITQNDGATFNLELPVNGSVTTSNADGFIGGWAVVEGSRFANVASGAIGALTSTVANDLATWLPGADIINDAAFAGSIDCGISINSLAFDAAATSAVPVTGLLDIASGGILVSANVGANDSTISGGSVTTSGGAFYIHQHNTAGLLEISAALTGNATLSKSGDGELLLSGTNNDLGTVYVHEGTLRVSGGDAIDDNSRVRVMGGANTVFEITAGQSETVGIIDGGVGGQGTVLINAGSTLTTNYTSTDTFGGSFAGSGVLVKEGGGNLIASGVSSFSGDVVVNESLFQLSNIGRMLDTASFTINKDGALLLDNNSGTRTGDRIGNSTPITLNSADGPFSGGTQPRGLAIRTDQNAATNEDIGVLNIASGASYAALEANNNGTSTESQIIADNFIRTAGATFNVRGRDLASPNNVRTTQLRISNATNQTAFINGMIGGGTGEGTVTRSIVPWAIGETIAGANIANTNMGNSFLSYIGGRGFSALDLATDYSTFSGAGGATDNVRESLTLDLAGLTSQTVNSLVIHNDNTAASTLNVTGAGAGNTLTNTSGGFLFTLNTGAAASSAHSTVLGGFDDGIATGGSEYVFHVVNPSAAADTATLTANVSSPLISNADIVKSGRGTLIFSAANTAGGGANRTVINEGAIEITDLDQIGGATGVVHFAGGTLRSGVGLTDDLGTRTFEVNVGGGSIDTNGVDTVITNLNLSGTGDFTKTGLGTLSLEGTPTDTSTGTLIVQRGVLELADAGGSNAFGSGGVEIRPIAFGGSTVTLRNGASDQIDDAATVRIFNVGGGSGAPSGGRWELNGFSETIGGLEMTSGSSSATIVTLAAGSVLTVNGDIILNNNRSGTGTSAEQVEITGAGTLDLGGALRTISVRSSVVENGTDAGIETIIQNGGIVKTGAEILYLENAGNTYAGGTVVNEGTVSIATDTNLGADAPGNGIELRNGGTLRSTGAFVTLTANRSVLLDGAGGGFEVAGGATNTLVVSSIISGHDCAVLTKTGVGALALTEANTYEGGTVVAEGTLIAANTTGSATGLGSVTVDSGAALGGDGIIAPGAGNGIALNGGLLVGDPLASSGTDLELVFSGAGSLVMGAGSTLTFDLWSGTGGVGLGDSDLLALTGVSGVTLGGTLEVLDPTSAATTFTLGDSWRLFDWTNLTGGAELPGEGTNIFSSINLPTLSGGFGWDTSGLYTLGTISVTPEPGRVTLIGLGLFSLLLRRRRTA